MESIFDKAIVTAILAVLGYFVAVIKSWIPPPQEVPRRIADAFRRLRRLSTSEKFTVLICDLERDEDRSQKSYVINAFRYWGRQDFQHCDLHWTLKSLSGETDNDKIRRGRKRLETERADLLIFGETATAGQSLRLWFVGRQGQHDFGSWPFTVVKDKSVLTEDFREAFDRWLVSVALANLPNLDDQHNRRLVEELKGSEKRLSQVLDNTRALPEPLQTQLLRARGRLRERIGELAGEEDMLLRAIEDFKRTLEQIRRCTDPLDWAAAQNNLGNALRHLGERESGTRRLEEAVAAYRDALEIFESGGVDHYSQTTHRNLVRAEDLLAKRR